MQRDEPDPVKAEAQVKEDVTSADLDADAMDALLKEELSDLVVDNESDLKRRIDNNEDIEILSVTKPEWNEFSSHTDPVSHVGLLGPTMLLDPSITNSVHLIMSGGLSTTGMISPTFVIE